MIYNNIIELIGSTPLVKLNKIMEKYNLKADIYAKIEYFNPAGSVKDRAALYMIEDAEKRGLISAGATIVEPTSGNTGIGLAMVAASKGYKVIMTMPDTMSVERQKFLSAYGAQIVLTPGKLGMQGAVDKAVEITKNTKNAFMPSQFDNSANPLAHYETTGVEIWNDLDGNVDYFVAGFGTGGTVSGTGKYLKEQNSNVHIVAVEPASSPLITEGRAGAHKIQGIGANFVPNNLNRDVVDEFMTADNDESLKVMKEIPSIEGYFVGISSAAALSVAIKIAQSDGAKGKKIVVLFPDSGDRYLSIL